MEDDWIVEYVHGRHTVQDYFDRFLLKDKILDFAFAGCPQLRASCIEHLWSAFVELDSVPRTDPFWTGTNMRPTFSKLCRFYGNPDAVDQRNLQGCWRSLAVALCSGSVGLFGRSSEALLREGELSLVDFVRTSQNLEDVSGWDTDRLAAEILLRLHLEEQSETILKDLIQTGSPDRRSWPNQVLGRLRSTG